jgi:hypothetical protein
MTTSSSEATIGGFTDADIEDVTKTVLAKLSDGVGRTLSWDPVPPALKGQAVELTDSQKAGFVDAARKSITGEKTTGFASFFNDDARAADRRTEKEREEFAANETAAQHLEVEFSKLTWNEFDKRRNSR